MSRPGADDLLELLWDNGLPALRTTPHFPPAPFQPFAAGSSSRAREVDKQRRHDDAVPAVGAVMDDDVVGLGSIPVHDDDDDDAVPWLHCPVIDDGDSDTAPLPPEFCAGLLSGYSALDAEPPEPDPTAPSSGIIARPSSDAATRVAPPDTAGTQQPKPSGGGGEGVMNFTFFSRPLHRPQAAAASPSCTNPLESTVVQTVAAASRLRSTPLFSEQRMAWLHPPPPKEPRAAAAAATPRAPPVPPATTDRHHHRHVEAAAGPTVTQHRLRPDTRAPDATTSSVCSGNGDGSQAMPSSRQPTAECSVSQEEDADDEPSAARRSSARGTKRSRTAEVHNLSERRRRDRINEKMRALQELIPNCNKIDKASMLEEAIEYLKSLQLQVQMMSMGTGLCVPVPPMLMQVPVVPPVAAAPFPHLGTVGLGFGGIGGAAFDLLPRCFAAAPQFPCPVMPGGAPPMAMPAPPHGSLFGMPPGQLVMSPFPHVVNGAAPAEQGAGLAPGGAGAGDRRPPVTVAPQGDPKQT